MSPLPRRLDLTQVRPGRRIHRSITLVPGADGSALLTLHIGMCQMGADLSAANLAQLRGILAELQCTHSATRVTT